MLPKWLLAPCRSRSRAVPPSALAGPAPLLAALLWAAAALAPPSLAGQEREGVHGRDVHGVVVSADDASPLVATAVRIVELGVEELTHADGRFHLENVPPGTYTLRADRLGYRVEERTVTVSEEGTNDVRIELEPAALSVDPLVVTGTARTRRAGESLRPVDVLGGRELLRDLGSTVAGSVEGEAGVTTASMGPATARPVIRGLSGDRVLVLEDGERVGDVSAASPDHASATEPLGVRRIEVVRGPAALLYGSNAMGGVVNVVRDEVPNGVPDRLTGRGTLEASSVDGGLAVGGEASVGLGSSVALRLEGTGRRAGDLATAEGDLPNTDREVLDVAGGASWIASSAGHAGASYRIHRNHYGIPGGFTGAHEEGVRIEMRRRQLKARAERVEGVDPLSRIEITGSFTDYGHEELERSGAIGTRFARRTATAEARAHHDGLGPFASGAFGVRWQWDDHRFGGATNTEDARASTVGLYLLEEYTAGPLTVEAGVRWDHGSVTPRRERESATIGEIRARTFRALSGSVGTLVDVGGGAALGANLSRAFRIPEVAELYSEGPHLAAYSFEVGNPELGEETGTGLDVFLRVDRETARAELAVFGNRIDDYVFPRNTGEISRVRLPIYQFTGEDALLTGAELSAEWSPDGRLVLEGDASHVRGTLTATEEPLPFIPPLQGGARARWERSGWFVQGGLRAAARQDRLGPFETPTPGYAVFDAAAGLRREIRGGLHSVTLRLTNLTDEAYRNHLSRTKEIMPEAGRGASLLYRVSF